MYNSGYNDDAWGGHWDQNPSNSQQSNHQLHDFQDEGAESPPPLPLGRQSHSEHLHANIPESFSAEDEPSDIVLWDSPQTSSRRPRSHSVSYDNRDRGVNKSSVSRSMSAKNFVGGPGGHNGNVLEEYENHYLASVTQQLETIKSTQDSILAELSDDIANLQFENVQLKNTNEHLMMQNTHLLQAIKDYTREVEQMREILRIRGLSPSTHKQSEEEGGVEKDGENKTDTNLEKVQIHPANDIKSSSEAPAKRKHREHREHRHRTSNPTPASPIPLNGHFENVSLNDEEQVGPKVDKLRSPGDEQVALLAKSPRSHGHHESTKGRSSSRPSVSKRKSVESKSSVGSNENESSVAGAGGSCLKNFFRFGSKKGKSKSSIRE